MYSNFFVCSLNFNIRTQPVVSYLGINVLRKIHTFIDKLFCVKLLYNSSTAILSFNPKLRLRVKFFIFFF